MQRLHAIVLKDLSRKQTAAVVSQCAFAWVSARFDEFAPVSAAACASLPIPVLKKVIIHAEKSFIEAFTTSLVSNDERSLTAAVHVLALVVELSEPFNNLLIPLEFMLGNEAFWQLCNHEYTKVREGMYLFIINVLKWGGHDLR